MLGRLAPLLILVAGCTAGDLSPIDRSGDPVRDEWREVAELGAQVLWDRGNGRPRQVVGAFAVTGAPEAAARGFLQAHAALFGLAPDGSDLVLTATRDGLAARYLRFQQQAGGLPVFGSQVVVALAKGGGELRAVNLAHRGRLAAPSTARDIGAAAAIAAARVRVASPREESAPIAIRGVDAAGSRPRLAYQVQIAARRATWDVGVDGASGAILWVRDRTWYATGTGLVYDANPIASTNTLTFTDGNDATTAALDAARVAVALPDLDGSGFLRGLYADARPALTSQRAQSAALAFSYDRTDNHFEEVMAYYHLDRAQTRIQALGFTDVNHRVQVAVVNDGNQDNSFYNPVSRALSFGAGGVDDAEDGDIVLHEYGHSIQDDQVPGFGNGDEGAMGEGFGDYLAGSFEAALAPAAGHAQLAAPACVGDWDATSYDTHTPRCLRRLDGLKHYPEDAADETHDDGEIWSAALWRARTAVGNDVADRVIIEAHFLLSNDETFERAAAAILMADQMLYAGDHVPALRRALYQHGVLRALQPGAAFPAVASAQPVNLVNPTVGGSYANNLDDTQSYTRPGAQALRVHFASIETEIDSGCFEGGCDNVYLFDGDGDLFQILNGSRTDVTTVQVPGDTVRIRLVTDASSQLEGYHVDRIDSMTGTPSVDAAVDAAIDGPTPIDAPADAAVTIDAPADAAVMIDAAVTIDAAAPADDAATGIDAPGIDATGDGGDEDDGCCSTGSQPAGALLAGGAALAALLRRRPR